MPDWCFQRVIVKHDDPNVMRRLKDAYLREAVCEEFLPMPPEYASRVKDYESWAHYHWGTITDFGEGRYGEPLAEHEGSINMRFDTQWSSPIALFLTLHELGFDLHAYIYDPGADVCVKIKGRKVKLFTFQCQRPDCIRKHIDRDLLKSVEDILDSQGIDHEERECSHGPWFRLMDIEEYIAECREFTPRRIRPFKPEGANTSKLTRKATEHPEG
jgi:hypothetical protein